MSTDAADRGAGESAGPTGSTWRAVARTDVQAWRAVRLHWIVGGIFVVTLGGAGVATAALSEAFYTSGDLPGTIGLLSGNAGWLFGSLVALVGLFVGVPALREGSDGREEPASPRSITGRVLGRGALVGVALLAGLVTLFVVALAAFEPFSILAFLAFAVATIALGVAYASVGVAVASVARSTPRAVGWLLALYVALTLLWDTWIVPLGLLLVSSGGDPAVLAGRPGWFDGLVAVSPGGAHAALAEAVVADEVTAVTGVALVALVAWLVLPPALATGVADRR